MFGSLRSASADGGVTSSFRRNLTLAGLYLGSDISALAITIGGRTCDIVPGSLQEVADIIVSATETVDASMPASPPLLSLPMHEELCLSGPPSCLSQRPRG